MTVRNNLIEYVLCGTKDQVEMHHLRKAKDIRNKIRTGDSMYSQ